MTGLKGLEVDEKRKRKFTASFFRELDRYPPKVRINLLKDCQEDIEKFGWNWTIKKWQKIT